MLHLSNAPLRILNKLEVFEQSFCIYQITKILGELNVDQIFFFFF